MNRTLHLVVPLLLAATYATFHLVSVASAPDETQWDLDTYYYAAQAYDQGLSPYKKSSLSKMAGEKVGLRFFYSPVVLPVLRGLTLFSKDTLHVVCLVFKVVALGLLLLLWMNMGVPRSQRGWFVLFALLAFDSTIFIDVHTGNISLFEQLLFWTAVALFLKNQVRWFLAIVVLLATVKLTPIVFLALPLAVHGRKQLRGVVLAALAFLAVEGLAALASPQLFSDFVSNFSGLGETGMVNPCLYSITREVGIYLSLPHAFPFLSYEFLALGMGVAWFVTARTVPKHESNRQWRTFFFVLTLALMLPRLKDYSYILVILPAFWFLVAPRMTWVAGLLLLLVCLPGPHGHWPGFATLGEYFPQYLVWFVLVAIWGYVVLHKPRIETTD